jgi:uncharacterized 2Fe-2S/4Fe-4S cluster protein (DUF4445 family)
MQIVFKIGGNSGTERIVSTLRGESLLDAARRVGIALDAPCGGKGTCGKCRVKLLEGSVKSEISRHLTPQEFSDGWRLACTSFVEGDLTVLIPETAGTWQNQIRIIGIDRFNKSINVNSGIELIKAELPAPSIDNPMADRERLLVKLEKQCGASRHLLTAKPDMDLYALRKLPAVLRQGNFSLDCVVRQQIFASGERVKFTVLDVFPHGEVPPVIAGLAVDIGTTTVSALLVDLLSGEILASASAGNGQIRYGADVISRIIESGSPSSDGAPNGLERLRRAITDECLVPLIASLCKTAGIPNSQIYRAAIAANTTMTHLFMGVDPAYLRLEPYTPAFFASGPIRGIDLGLPLHPDADLMLAPAVGSYVGGDISAGVFASELFKQEEMSLLVDLGTNGELVLGYGELLMCCACSAGPAFEGGDISCGMRATTGAIEACVIDGETMEPQIKIIGPADQKPIGVCGSGLIDLIGELFRHGIINARGRFIKDGKRVRRDEWGGAAYVVATPDESADDREISLGESDIDNFIRAKGAIFSAIQTMLAILDFDVSVIEHVYVAGGIGSVINIRQAVRIGMLPNLPIEKYQYIGNSSLGGAYSMLVSQEAVETVEKIGRNMTYIELSTHPGYMDELVAASFLPHTNGALFENIK